MDDTAPGSAPKPTPPVGTFSRGRQVARYVVLELLGSGAMGAVYAAWDPQLDRRVALKLVRQDALRAHGTDATERLLREARALAKLSHPCVVQVFDAGEVEGQVFLAMEYVAGETLDDFSRATHSLDEKLTVLRSAGRGLAAAHAAGIAHRDFKPANVMVGLDGRTRVVDFGLARPAASVARGAVDSGSLAAAPVTAPPIDLGKALTQRGALVGTPRYMSAEQFRGERADAASDQFAFCITAWELLFGELPFAGQDLEALRTAVVEGKRRPAPANVVPAAVTAALERGLSTDAKARFPSMDELLRALEPVEPRVKRPPRWLLGAAALVVAGLGAGGTRVARCRGEAAEAVGTFRDGDAMALSAAFETTRVPFAKDTATRATAALRAWTQSFGRATGQACLGEPLVGARSSADLERRTCLDASSRQLSVLLEAFRTPDAKVVENAARAIGNLPDVSQCASGRQVLEQPGDASQRATAEKVRAQLAESAALADLGRLDQADSAAATALEEARQLAFPPLLASAALQAGKVRFESGKLDEASGLARETARVALASGADVTALHATVLATRIEAKRSHTDEMRTWLSLAQALDERLGRAPPLSATVFEAKGLVSRSLSEFDEAVSAFGKARTLAREAGLTGLELTAAFGEGAALQRLGRCPDAEAVFRDGLARLEAVAGPTHVRLAGPLNNLALCVSMRSPDEARGLYERALAITTAVGPDSGLVAAPLLNLAEFELRRGEVARAKPYLERGRRAAAALGPGHSMAAYAEGLVAKLAFAEGDVDGADAAFRRGLETMERARGPGNAETADFLLGLGLCAERRGRVAEAKQQLTLSLSRLDRATVTPYSRAEGHLALARLALAEGELETSRSLLAQVRVDLTTLGAMGQRLAQEAEVVASGLQ